MGSAYATAPVIFSNHPLATEIPKLVYNPFGLADQLAGAGGRWTDGIWMLHGKTPRDIIAVLADIGNVVWSNNDYKYPIVSATAVHEQWRGEFTTTLCQDLDFTNERTKAWITGDYGFVDSVPETGWDCVVYLFGPEIERDSWQKRCMLEYILGQLKEFETVGGFVEQEGKVGIAVKDSNGWTEESKKRLEDLCRLVSNFRVYDSTNLDDCNSINWTESGEFEIEVTVNKKMKVEVKQNRSMDEQIQQMENQSSMFSEEKDQIHISTKDDAGEVEVQQNRSMDEQIQQMVNQSSVFIEEKGQIQICTQDGVINKRDCSDFVQTVLTGLPPDVTMFFKGSNFQFDRKLLERMDQQSQQKPIQQQLMRLQNIGVRVNPNGYRLKFNYGNIQPENQETLLQVVKEILDITERIILDHYTWTFSHYNLGHWQSLTEEGERRVLLLGAEPNDQNVAGRQGRDMGEWFRTACPDTFHNYKFYTNNILQLFGAMELPTFLGQWRDLHIEHGHMTRLFQEGAFTQPLRHLRYADIKAIGGVGAANIQEITAYAHQNLDTIVEFWFPQDGSLPPTHTVIQGGNAQIVFQTIILPALRKRKPENPNWTGLYTDMPHPSWQKSYKEMRTRSLQMKEKWLKF